MANNYSGSKKKETHQDRPYLQIPLPSLEEEQKMYEEWLKKQKEAEKLKEREAIIIDMQ
tara:strand:- start:114 stop:290 length:177 start_codon:yes stop_codon:yes gene_type:complete